MKKKIKKTELSRKGKKQVKNKNISLSIVDLLDTEEDFILKLKDVSNKVISFEDGAAYATVATS